VLVRIRTKPTMVFSPNALAASRAMWALDQHETHAVRTHHDWCLLGDVEHAGGDFVHALFAQAWRGV
jgi:hypothetical protein